MIKLIIYKTYWINADCYGTNFLYETYRIGVLIIVLCIVLHKFLHLHVA